MGVKVTTKKDLRGLAILQSKIRAIDELILTIGVQGQRAAVRVGRGSRGGGGTALGAVALFNEFGTDTIPARPFLRPAIIGNREATAATIAKEMSRFIAKQRQDALTTLGRIGSSIAFNVRARIENSGAFVPNDPDTVKQKGSSRPLHNTGRLAQSISWAARSQTGTIIAEGTGKGRSV